MEDGFTGTFIEAHHLEEAITRLIPQSMTARTLTSGEAAALIDRLTRRRRQAVDAVLRSDRRVS